MSNGSGKSPIRQLLDQGWNYTPLGNRVTPGTQAPIEPPGGVYLDSADAFVKNRAAQPPNVTLSEAELRTILERQLRSARAQLDSVRAGWGDRAARRASRMRGMDPRGWQELEKVLPDAEARVKALQQHIAESRNRMLQRDGKLPGTDTNPVGRPPSTGGGTLPGGGGKPPSTVDLKVPAPGKPPKGGGGAGRVGLLGGLLASTEGALLWGASKLPGFARGPMTRFALWAPRAVQGVTLFVGNTVATILSAPIVVKGAVVLGTLIIVGGVIYYLLPSGELVVLGEDNVTYSVVVRSVPDFDGGDVLLERIEGNATEVLADRAAETGYTYDLKFGPFPTFAEAAEALCGAITSGPPEVGSGGLRYASFTFDGGRRYALPVNPCGE